MGISRLCITNMHFGFSLFCVIFKSQKLCYDWYAIYTRAPSISTSLRCFSEYPWGKSIPHSNITLSWGMTYGYECIFFFFYLVLLWEHKSKNEFIGYLKNARFYVTLCNLFSNNPSIFCLLLALEKQEYCFT